MRITTLRNINPLTIFWQVFSIRNRFEKRWNPQPATISVLLTKNGPQRIKLGYKTEKIHEKGLEMEKRDLELIELSKDREPELNKLWQDHLEYEEQLEVFNRRVYLTPSEEIERKTIQKKKLKGKDQIEKILARLRAQSS